jgi:hypothetical protein
VWRDNLNTSTNLPNDTTPGSVTEDDYQVWKDHFGQTGPGSGAAHSANVPEPPSGLLGLLAAGLAVLTRRQPRTPN